MFIESSFRWVGGYGSKVKYKMKGFFSFATGKETLFFFLKLLWSPVNDTDFNDMHQEIVYPLRNEIMKCDVK